MNLLAKNPSNSVKTAHFAVTLVTILIGLGLEGCLQVKPHKPAPAEHAPEQGPTGPDDKDGNGKPEERGSSNVDGRLVLSLVDLGQVAAVSDEAAGQVLAENCGTCHSPAHADRLDLTAIPASVTLSDIKKRVQSDKTARGHMPVGKLLTAAELATLVAWIEGRINPISSDSFAAYKVAARVAGASDLVTLDNLGGGRFALQLGKVAVGGILNFVAVVTGLDGSVNEYNLEQIAVPQDGNA
jgi:mono/diheme cytochrome c family protein